ncbi:MAG: hypothetical protein N3C60_07570 [Calditerrivibrio sp.]|nr:hypothetical protein [Calditerrivibrio sp.]
MRVNFLIFFLVLIAFSVYAEDQLINIQNLQKSLQAKEKQLAEKEKQLNEKEKKLKLLEDDLKAKQKELEDIRASLQKLYDDIKGVDDENIDKLVKTLSNTKPKSAAAILEKMEEGQAVKVLKKMDSKKAGNIMTAMGKTNPEKAAKISEQLLPPKK